MSQNFLSSLARIREIVVDSFSYFLSTTVKLYNSLDEYSTKDDNKENTKKKQKRNICNPKHQRNMLLSHVAKKYLNVSLRMSRQNKYLSYLDLIYGYNFYFILHVFFL